MFVNYFSEKCVQLIEQSDKLQTDKILQKVQEYLEIDICELCGEYTFIPLKSDTNHSNRNTFYCGNCDKYVCRECLPEYIVYRNDDGANDCLMCDCDECKCPYWEESWFDDFYCKKCYIQKNCNMCKTKLMPCRYEDSKNQPVSLDSILTCRKCENKIMEEK